MHHNPELVLLLVSSCGEEKLMYDEKTMLQEIISLGNVMTQIKDIDILMETILTEARKLANGDAGSIYRCMGNMLQFSYTQNDTHQSKLPPGKKLIYSTFSSEINMQSISGYVASTGKILNLDNVNALDDSYPFTFNRSIDEKTGYRTVSMLTIPMSTATGRIIGVLQLINAKDIEANVIPFDPDYIPLIQHFANNAAIALERAEMTRDIILRMIKMAELRDPKETGAHVNRVGAYSAELYEAWARKHDVPLSELKYFKDLLRIAAMLHDVGKVGISDTVLKKPGKLDFAEFEIIKTHPHIGAKLFTNQQSELDAMSLDIALGHHERWDGKGYPGFIDVHSGSPLPDKTSPEGKALGKAGLEIPLWARIVALADVYDALSSRRCYKEPWTEDMVLAELKSCSGTNFDPELTELFLSISDQMNAIRNNYPDTGDEE